MPKPKPFKFEQPPEKLTGYHLPYLLSAEAGTLTYNTEHYRITGVPNNAKALELCGLLAYGSDGMRLTDLGRTMLDAWKASPEGQAWAAVMSPDQAAWVRENVWPPLWLRNHNHIPSTTFACACQKPPSSKCQLDQHSACRHDGHPVNETVIATTRGRAARLPEPYEHRPPAGRHGSRIAHGVNDLAWVWLAGAPCREICNCTCHTPSPATATPAPVAPPAQLDLFDAVPH
ncbi:hypothetical protein [Streptomyces turgidiscabies]|uniref:hypothetical protein n=1 Tax=Streptomyces turgidiscabies TaxID=85558 RepID=UPI0038F70896